MKIETMARECRRLWVRVMRTDGTKPKTKYENNCPACQFVVDKFGYLRCKECPLLMLWTGGKPATKYELQDGNTPCQENKHSPYRLYFLSDHGSIGGKDMFMRQTAGRLIVEYLEKHWPKIKPKKRKAAK